MQSNSDRQRQVSARDVRRSSDRIQSMHDVFSNPYRQTVLYYLQEDENPADVHELAEWAISQCQKLDGDDVDRASESRTAEWFLHRHVLSMDEVGLVEYDPEGDTVSLPDDVCVTVHAPWDEQ